MISVVCVGLVVGVLSPRCRSVVVHDVSIVVVHHSPLWPAAGVLVILLREYMNVPFGVLIVVSHNVLIVIVIVPVVV